MENFLLDSLAEQCKADCQLLNIMFVLLSQCNENCIHCYIPDHVNAGLPTWKVKELIDEARGLGALNVTFTGGEILLRKDLLELISYARSRYMRVFLMSNGVALNEQIIASLADMHIANFSTTIFSMDPIIHDFITRKTGSLELLLNNLKLLKKYGISVTIKTPLMNHNRDCYREIYEFAKKNGFEFMTSPTIFSKINGDSSPHDLEITDELDRVIRETDLINSDYRSGIISKITDGIPCSAGFSNICINYDGTVWPCNTLTLPVGNVFSQTLQTIWNESFVLLDWRGRAVSVPEPCRNCLFSEKCTRCPGLAYMEDSDLFGCSTSSRRIAIYRQ